MPIIENKKNRPTNPHLKEMRDRRREQRTKFFVKRKEREHDDYKGIKLFVDGEEVEINDAAKFILEQLVADLKKPQTENDK